jgi:hypothetical protein
MIVYRDERRLRDTAALVGALRRGIDRDELLIGFGELEAGVVDADPAAAPVFRHAAAALGRGWISGNWEDFNSAFGKVAAMPLPDTIFVPVSEGYAYYALYPEMYIESAGRFFEECRPRRVCVIGIRSIGTSLSAVVTGALELLGCEVQSLTVRPQGHPFDRRLELPAGVRQDADFYAIVDEGPGLSGSSFASVAGHFPAERVALFTSWEGDPGRFVNEGAKLLWPCWRKYWTEFRARWPGAVDLSGGCWREVVGLPAAVNPQHEARKYLVGDTLYKFEGLGEYGRRRVERAAALANAGFGPPVQSLERGFAGFHFVRPAQHRLNGPSLDWIANYLAFRQHEFRAERTFSFDQLAAMVEFNAGLDADRSMRREFEERPTCAVDGRMLPHEWIFDGERWLKTDSVDHSSNHFYPGPADIAWDLAGAAVEFDMGPAAFEYLLRRYRETSGDAVSNRLAGFFVTAYLAFRLGYVTMAAQATRDTPDGARFEALGQRYRRRLESAKEVQVHA